MTQANAQDHKYSNHLINESSPYLLQHAHNPVDWYPWGEEALQKAKEENKLILVSIGYSACHWCHVMEHESFENEEIAQLMNEHFVCIKVDREERPDVDQVYMNAVHLMNGQGGWPLNCFALPDGRPVYGATYFPPNKWKQTLQSLYLSYQEDSKKFEDFAQNLLNGIVQSEVITTRAPKSDFHEKELHQIFENISRSFDMKEGGFGKAPKFPLPIGLEFILAYGHKYDHQPAHDFLFLTLDKMAKGGIYDQIGGGFARYSVDDIWKAPHFEKMLYDNGQLISLYSQAYKLNPSELYEKTIRQTLEFISREMTQEEGGFYSALDADSEGVEGKYYVWTHLEIHEVLGTDADLFCDFFGIKEKGNWEKGENILMQSADQMLLQKKYQLDAFSLKQKITQLSKILLAYRENRTRPGLDDKILTSWNALMMQGYTDAFAALGDHAYLQIAEKNAEFIWHKLSDQKGKVFRTYKNGHAKIDAFLDDYAILVKTYLSLYQITFKPIYLERAELLLEYCQEYFLHPESKMYYYTQKSSSLLVARKMELSDNVIPASNSMMAHNLMTMGVIKSEELLIDHARDMLLNIQEKLVKGQVYYANWDLLMMRFLETPKEIVVMGEHYVAFSQELQQHYLFNSLFVGSKKESYLPLMKERFLDGKTLIYICENKTCSLPVANIEEALKLLQ
ncbi:MAG: DUF255 domain-containing protein [Bacteroidales bacterium]|nr:DUF255 domain-containing protein [Bacteroidales bacterium]